MKDNNFMSSIITIEDCDDYVANRFSLVLIAAQRGKELNHGAPALIGDVRGKEAVIALKEIASGKIKNIENLEKSIIKKTVTENQEEVNINDSKLTDDRNNRVLHEIESMKKAKPQSESQVFKDEEVIKE